MAFFDLFLTLAFRHGNFDGTSRYNTDSAECVEIYSKYTGQKTGEMCIDHPGYTNRKTRLYFHGYSVAAPYNPEHENY